MALLHHFTTNEGKKALAVSLNPSSTYTYSVDEEALFKGIMASIEQFAHDNDFNMIVLSQNPTIRTNRTGGIFEKTINARIAQIDKQFKCSPLEQFSYNPPYQLEDMDIIWENSTQLLKEE